ncbi:MAG: RIP metalloprotease RseP [Neisseria sp.]|uniref:RIP metalloprotease RseP n=1 Tax=Neisseria sp. TaxID=192066 RepID=UPI0026DC8977|nr:RIP metalloprotease RseP [Neisseria sp.]MDO4640480.1 RIP metalloprotease RseP [Neisseria sp.]
MLTIIAFLAAILFLVSLHEFGHYFIARRCGVKVLRFSVGFGKPFYTKKIGDTEWCLAPIPLGGYVKMVDTREGEVAAEDLPYAFDKQPPAKRIAIVAAGPLTNLILAVLLFGISFSFGVTEVKPFVGTVVKDSIAAKAGFHEGDLILSVNGEPVKDWVDARTKITLSLDAGKVDVRVVDSQNQPALRSINIAGTPEAAQVAKQNGNIGLDAFKRANRIGKVVDNSPAASAGLKKGDSIISVDGKMTPSWQDWSEIIRNSPGQKLLLGVVRNENNLQIAIRPDSQESRDRSRLTGYIGVLSGLDEAWEQKISRKYVPSVAEAFEMGWRKTVEFSTLTVGFFGKLITGQASINHISGPLTIADMAGKTAAISVQAYLEFLALVSVSLGVFNLMPVPVLDGGHLVFYAAEWLRGKPLSERVQMMGIRFGIAAMLMLMLLAFFNDITRLFG